MVRRAACVIMAAVVGLAACGATGVGLRHPGRSMHVRGGWPPAVDPGGVATPQSLTAQASGANVVLDWQDVAGATEYRVYRGFGAALSPIAVVSSSAYTDDQAVAGSTHYYRVAAANGTGGVSTLSTEASARPLVVTDYGDAPYAAMWFQDPDWNWTRPSALRAQTLAKLAQFDLLITGPFIFEGADSTGVGAPNEEPFYCRFIQDLRQLNPDEAVVSYLHPWQLRADGATATALMNPYRRTWELAARYHGSSGYGRTVDGTILDGRDYVGTRILNYMLPGMADSVAAIFVDAIEHLGQATGMATAINVGVFLDDMSTDLQFYDYYTTADHSASGPYGEVQDVLDMDRDGVVYKNDSDEKTAFWKYEYDLVMALRREFAEHNMPRKLITANSDMGEEPAGTERPYAIPTLAQLDGTMFEGVNYWDPGCCASSGAWSQLFARRWKLTGAQIEPPAAIALCYTDSSSTYMGEVLALAIDSWVDAGRTGHNAANQYVVEMPPRTLAQMQAPGVYEGYSFSAGSGGAPDTLVASWSNVKARMALHPRTGSSLSLDVWPYAIRKRADGSFMSRGGGWPAGGSTVVAPVASFTGTPLAGTAPLTVTFTDASTNSPTSWAWTFGDGGTSTAQNPSHQYAAAGTYTVAMTATNAAGSNTQTRTGYITATTCVVAISGTDMTDDIMEDLALYTITGSGFGTKATGAPLQFDDFEEGLDGNVLTTYSGTNRWYSIGANTDQTADFPHYEADAAHDGSVGLLCNFSSPVSTCAFGYNSMTAFDDGFYLDAWIKYTFTGNQARSWKPWVMYGDSGGGYAGNPAVDWHGNCDGSVVGAGYRGDSTGWEVYNGGLSTSDFTSIMHHLQVVVLPNSPRTASNGTYRIYLDCVPIFDSTNRRIHSDDAYNFSSLSLGYYLTLDQQSCSTPRGSPASMMWDDVYVDGSQARIEIGDSPTYASCTHREIQIPETWSSAQITFLSRHGSFQAGDIAYLFVIDSLGNVSAGHQIFLE